jgi:hypothetical protein
MNDLQEVQKKSFGLKNLNTLYPGDIKRIYKNERSFYRIEKNTYEKGLSFIWILFPGKAKSKTEESAIMRKSKIE